MQGVAAEEPFRELLETIFSHEDHSAAKPQPKPRCVQEPVSSRDTNAPGNCAKNKTLAR
jgi:hypothetical protein